MSNVALGVFCALSASLHQLLEILFFHAGPIADFGEREDIAGVADLAYMRGNAQGHFLADRLLGGSNVHVLFELRDVDLEHRFDAKILHLVDQLLLGSLWGSTGDDGEHADRQEEKGLLHGEKVFGCSHNKADK